MIEFALTDEIKALGISKLVATADYLIVYNNNEFVQSKYYGEKGLERTLNELKVKMIDSKAFGDQQAVERKIFLISEIWVNAVTKTSKGK